MDFNRRKLRLPNNEPVGMSQPGMIPSNAYTTNKNRKMYKLSNQQSNNIDSGGTDENDSGGEVNDATFYAHPVKPHQKNPSIRQIIHKQPVTPMSSVGMDSGMSSGIENGSVVLKKAVQQTDSNTSTGSMMCHNTNIKLDMERRMQEAQERREKLRLKEVKEFRSHTASPLAADKSSDAYDPDEDQERFKKKKKNIKKDAEPVSGQNYIQIKYPPLSNSHTEKAGQPSDSEDSYIDDQAKKQAVKPKQNITKENLEKSLRLFNENSKQHSTKHIYQSREDFADDENDEDAKSNDSSNNGHDAVETPIILNQDKSPIVESTAIISKKPVKVQVSNQTSLGGVLDSGHHSPLVVTTSNSEKDCSCTTTSASEFGESSHQQCCSSHTNSIKNIGNNNNNKKIVEAGVKNSIKEDVKEKLSIETKLSDVSSNRNKQYVNNTKAVATFHTNGTQRVTGPNPHQTKPGDYAYASKFATTMAKVPSTIKAQPTSKRVNGVTLRDLYSLRAVLSDSDNGTVFSGRRRIDNAAVAIKRIMKGKVKRWHMIKEKSVPMEIALLRKVNETRHAGVVTLLEWFECSDCFLLVMARPTPVLDLFDYVSEKKRLDENTSKMIFVQVVEAMVHCHQRSVLHRDIKLENILVKTDTLISTIIDFGCGTHLHSNLYKDFAGTPQYYPPEYYICKQYHGLPAAVWSVGVMLYAMLCGRLPFASAHEIVHLEPSWHGSFCRKISPAAKDLVEHMLKKQPRRRLQMQEILKHRWLKNAKYDSATGNVTVMTDDNNLVSNNGNQFQETIVSGSVKEGSSSSTGKSLPMFN